MVQYRVIIKYTILSIILLSSTMIPAPSQAASLEKRISSAEKQIRQLQKTIIKMRSQKGSGVSFASTPDTSRSFADMETRLSQLETQLRQMYGEIEKGNHQLTLLNKRIGALTKDYEFRIAELEKKAITPTPMPSSEKSLPSNPAQNKPVSQNSSAPKAATSTPAVAPILPDVSETKQYDFARGLVFNGEYDRAEKALKEFLATREKSTLAGNAQYWLGQIYFAEKKYLEATKTFLDGYNKYPDSNKAPAFLLKIGMSLNAIGEKEEACNSFAELSRKYPNSDENKKRRAIEEKKASCQ